ncbi:flagellar hook-basal body complex protein FliE [Tsuneonella sp. CC-YZS046]|uniref:flagellar hook-basal body complex protein FliE n=1 Tax=Tsuneonella sp. CC-YZS046 TaxID=3042152 RepID=UPI002D76A407|nr:flagellar hook-basal body complex protein FliE [Tsuneonella sp. CC-YZS046]WRO66835.1 flagellar hook-basal body complex protein FliE [Tsuneonella sp. CC-YZS046]
MNPINSGAGAAGVHDIIALRQQIIDRSQLLQQLRAPDAQAASSAAQGPAGGFSDNLRTALDKVNQTQATAEALSTGYEKGEVTDIAKVMMARQEAGLAFEATLQVRNKLLSAYQDIMRMGV